MLLKNYFFYFSNVFYAGMFSIWGGLALLLLTALLAVFFLPALRAAAYRARLLQLLTVGSLITLGFAFYTGEYEFPEDAASLHFASLPAGEPTCGTAEHGWTKAGYGMGNPCPAGCYRGLTLRKKMRLTGFPPWPEYKRELQCWTR